MRRYGSQLPKERHALTAPRTLAPTPNAYAVAFAKDLYLFSGLSGTQHFFDLWEARG